MKNVFYITILCITAVITAVINHTPLKETGSTPISKKEWNNEVNLIINRHSMGDEQNIWESVSGWEALRQKGYSPYAAYFTLLPPKETES